MVIKRLLKQAYPAHVAWYMLKNLKRTARAWRYGASATGGAYSSRPPAEAAARALKWASEFRRRVSPAARGTPEFVVEVGVGDSLAMCVLWIGFGARRVWGVDAFADPRDLVREKAIVQSLLRSVPDEERARILATVDLRGESLETDDARLRYVANTPCERLLEVVPPSTVDVIYSLALLEHVQDLGRGLQALYAALRPGGEMIHQVDLRNHGVLNELGEGAFRRPSPTIWRLMGSAWGLPNREALGVYRDTLKSLGAEVHVESEKEYEVGYPEAGQRVSEIQDEHAVRVFWLHARQPEPLEAGRGGTPRDGICSASLP